MFATPYFLSRVLSIPRRELTHYKGEPDPYKGDANNQVRLAKVVLGKVSIVRGWDLDCPGMCIPQRVRDLAKEVLELLYNASTGITPATLQVADPCALILSASSRSNQTRMHITAGPYPGLW